jgi:uncharacterized protein (TIGR02679 family)
MGRKAPGARPERGLSEADPLDRPELARLWVELAHRFGDGRPPLALTLAGLSLPERQAVADLLGLDRLPPATARIRLDRLAAACGVEGHAGLRALVERRLGPITDRRAARLESQQARDSLWAWLGESAAGLPLASGDRALVEPWLEAVRAAGVPGGDLAAHRRRLDRALRVLAALPADGVALASLAADHLGDAHALDRGRATASLVLDAVAAALGRQRASDAEGARLLWEEVGVVPDPLSSTVLCLGLRPPEPGADPLAAWLDAAAASCEPAVVTLAQLRRWPLAPLPAGAVAFVVENPTLLSEAAVRKWAGPALVCSSGRPSIAAVTLLRQLAAAGATLAQHADFDGGGLSITAWLADRAGTTPWRMGADDYLAALAVPRERVPLAGRLPPSPWDPGLREAMATGAVAVHEEEIRTALLSAMAAVPASASARGRLA